MAFWEDADPGDVLMRPKCGDLGFAKRLRTRQHGGYLPITNVLSTQDLIAGSRELKDTTTLNPNSDNLLAVLKSFL